MRNKMSEKEMLPAIQLLPCPAARELVDALLVEIGRLQDEVVKIQEELGKLNGVG
jgi:hypothetical protein